MSTRSVRFDEATEKELAKLKKATGASISEILKRGVFAYGKAARGDSARKPFEIYDALDLGPGGYARAPAKEAKRAIAEVIRRKRRR